MIKHQRFTFIHFPKTGGTSFLFYYNRLKGLEKQTLDHKGVCYLTRQELEQDIVGFIRNPLDWYMSLYFYFRNTSSLKWRNGLMGQTVYFEREKINFYNQDRKSIIQDFRECMLQLETKPFLHLINNKAQLCETSYDLFSNIYLALFCSDFNLHQVVKLYCFEEFNKEMNRIQRKYNLPIEDITRARKSLGKDQFGIKDLYTKEIIEMLCSRFHRDIKNKFKREMLWEF